MERLEEKISDWVFTMNRHLH